MEKLLGLRDTHGSLIKEVRGRGLLIALEFNQNCAMEVVTNCLRNGLVLNPVSDNAIRFMPPLIITESDADAAVRIIDRVLAEKRAAAPA